MRRYYRGILYRVICEIASRISAIRSIPRFPSTRRTRAIAQIAYGDVRERVSIVRQSFDKSSNRMTLIASVHMRVCRPKNLLRAIRRLNVRFDVCPTPRAFPSIPLTILPIVSDFTSRLHSLNASQCTPSLNPALTHAIPRPTLCWGLRTEGQSYPHVGDYTQCNALTREDDANARGRKRCNS